VNDLTHPYTRKIIEVSTTIPRKTKKKQNKQKKKFREKKNSKITVPGHFRDQDLGTNTQRSVTKNFGRDEKKSKKELLDETATQPNASTLRPHIKGRNEITTRAFSSP
jgi:hypothetical protein